MNSHIIHRRKKGLVYRLLSFVLIVTFLSETLLPPAWAQSVLNLPIPGATVNLTPAFHPVLVKGILVYPDDPLKFDFVIDQGDTHLNEKDFQEESKKLVKYFLASLTIPEKEMWVNLSPYEKDRIIPSDFGQTEMGRDLLAQDYMLKQLTSSLLIPDSDLGKKFWDRVYQKAEEQFGTRDIPMNTFNKIWIVPETAEIYENEKGAFVVKSHLKVMLDEDYLALEMNKNSTQHGLGDVKKDELKKINGVQSQILKEILLPEIEREVNEGKIFSNLRQIYYSMILASWYKKSLKESLLGKIYVDQNKLAGVESEDPEVIQKIYERYVDAFKKGVYDFVKEDYDPQTQEIIPRKYFSGGVKMDFAMKAATDMDAIRQAVVRPAVVTVAAREIGVPQDVRPTSPNRSVQQDLSNLRSNLASKARTLNIKAQKRDLKREVLDMRVQKEGRSLYLLMRNVLDFYTDGIKANVPKEQLQQFIQSEIFEPLDRDILPAMRADTRLSELTFPHALPTAKEALILGMVHDMDNDLLIERAESLAEISIESALALLAFQGMHLRGGLDEEDYQVVVILLEKILPELKRLIDQKQDQEALRMTRFIWAGLLSEGPQEGYENWFNRTMKGISAKTSVPEDFLQGVFRKFTRQLSLGVQFRFKGNFYSIDDIKMMEEKQVALSSLVSDRKAIQRYASRTRAPMQKSVLMPIVVILKGIKKTKRISTTADLKDIDQDDTISLIEAIKQQKAADPNIDEGLSLASKYGVPLQWTPRGIEFVEMDANEYSDAMENYLHNIAVSMTGPKARKNLPKKIRVPFNKEKWRNIYRAGNVAHEILHLSYYLLSEEQEFEFIRGMIDSMGHLSLAELPVGYKSGQFKEAIEALMQTPIDSDSLREFFKTHKLAVWAREVIAEHWSRAAAYYLKLESRGVLQTFEFEYLREKVFPQYENYFISLGIAKHHDAAMTSSYDARELAADRRSPLDIFLAQPTFEAKYAERIRELSGNQPDRLEALNLMISELIVSSHFHSDIREFESKDLNTIPDSYGVLKTLILDMLSFSDEAYKDGDDPKIDEARKMMWKLGEVAFDKILYQQPQDFNHPFPLAGTYMASRQLNALPLLDIAGGPRAARYMKNIGQKKLVIADKSYFIEGYLNRAKEKFSLGDNVVIRRLDANDVEGLFQEKEYRHIRLGNADTYVGALSDSFYTVLLSKVALGGSVSVEFMPINPKDHSYREIKQRTRGDLSWTQTAGTFESLSNEKMSYYLFIRGGLQSLADFVSLKSKNSPVQLRIDWRAKGTLPQISVVWREDGKTKVRRMDKRYVRILGEAVPISNRPLMGTVTSELFPQNADTESIYGVIERMIYDFNVQSLANLISIKEVTMSAKVSSLWDLSGAEMEDVKQQIIQQSYDLHAEGGMFAITDDMWRFIRTKDEHTRFSQVYRDENGKVQGFILAYQEGYDPEVHIEKLGVTVEVRERQISTRLLNALAKQAEAKNMQRVKLLVLKTNTKAQEVYENLGFLNRTPVETIYDDQFNAFLFYTDQDILLRNTEFRLTEEEAAPVIGPGEVELRIDWRSSQIRPMANLLWRKDDKLLKHRLNTKQNDLLVSLLPKNMRPAAGSVTSIRFSEEERLDQVLILRKIHEELDHSLQLQNTLPSDEAMMQIERSDRAMIGNRLLKGVLGVGALLAVLSNPSAAEDTSTRISRPALPAIRARLINEGLIPLGPQDLGVFLQLGAYRVWNNSLAGKYVPTTRAETILGRFGEIPDPVKTSMGDMGREKFNKSGGGFLRFVVLLGNPEVVERTDLPSKVESADEFFRIQDDLRNERFDWINSQINRASGDLVLIELQARDITNKIAKLPQEKSDKDKEQEKALHQRLTALKVQYGATEAQLERLLADRKRLEDYDINTDIDRASLSTNGNGRNLGGRPVSAATQRFINWVEQYEGKEIDKTQRELADEFDIKAATVNRILKKFGITSRGQPARLRVKRLKADLEAYRSKKITQSLRSIGGVYGLSADTVNKAVKMLNVQTTGRIGFSYINGNRSNGNGRADAAMTAADLAQYESVLQQEIQVLFTQRMSRRSFLKSVITGSVLGYFYLMPSSAAAKDAQRNVFVLGHRHVNPADIEPLEIDLFNVDGVEQTGDKKRQVDQQYKDKLSQQQSKLAESISEYKKDIETILRILSDPNSKISTLGIEGTPEDAARLERDVREAYQAAQDNFRMHGLDPNSQLLDDLFLALYDPLFYLKAKGHEQLKDVSIIGIDSGPLKEKQTAQMAEYLSLRNQIIDIARAKGVAFKIFSDWYSYTNGFLEQNRAPTPEEIQKGKAMFDLPELQQLAEWALINRKEFILTARERDQYMVEAISREPKGMLVMIGQNHAEGVNRGLRRIDGIKIAPVDQAMLDRSGAALKLVTPEVLDRLELGQLVNDMLGDPRNRPDPVEFLRFSYEDLRAALGEFDLQRNIESYERSKTFQELDNLLPYIYDVINTLLEQHSDDVILFAGRDADTLYDAARTLEPTDNNLVLLPGSIDFWDELPWNDDMEAQRVFLAQYGITKAELKKGRRFVVVDSGFSGSVGKRLREIAQKVYALSDSEVRSLFPIRLVSYWPSFKETLNNNNIQSIKPEEPLQKDQLTLFPKTHSKHNIRNELYHLIAVSLQLLPKFHGPYGYVEQNGRISAVPQDAIKQTDIDNFLTINDSVVNHAAALMIQKKVVDYFEEKRLENDRAMVSASEVVAMLVVEVSAISRNFDSIFAIVNAGKEIAELSPREYRNISVDDLTDPTQKVIDKMTTGMQNAQGRVIVVPLQTALDNLLAIGKFMQLSRNAQQLVWDVFTPLKEQFVGSMGNILSSYIDMFEGLGAKLSQPTLTEPLSGGEQEFITAAKRRIKGNDQRARDYIARAVKPKTDAAMTTKGLSDPSNMMRELFEAASQDSTVPLSDLGDAGDIIREMSDPQTWETAPAQVRDHAKRILELALRIKRNLTRDELGGFLPAFGQMIQVYANMKVKGTVLKDSVIVIFHDLSTPINTIHMSAALVSSDKSADELRAKIDYLEGEFKKFEITMRQGNLTELQYFSQFELFSQHLKTMIDDIRSMQMPPIKQSQINGIMTGLEQLETQFNHYLQGEIVRKSMSLNQFFTIYKFQTGALDIAITTKLPKENILVNIDRVFLFSALNNIVLNAIEAIREHDKKLLDAGQERPARAVDVVLETDPQNQEVVIKISDNGPGIPEEVKAHIFEKGYSTKPAQEGKPRGLGLYSVMRIVQGHKGRIDVETVVGKGTTFTIHLPLPSKETPEEAGKVVALFSENGATKKSSDKAMTDWTADKYGMISNIMRTLDQEDSYYQGRIKKTIDGLIQSGKQPRILLIGAGGGEIIRNLRKAYGDQIDLSFINKEGYIDIDVDEYQRFLSKRKIDVPDAELEEQIAYMKQHAIKYDVDQDMSDALPDFGDKQFDVVVVARQTLIYTRFKFRLLQEIKKVLAKGGVGFINDFSHVQMEQGRANVDLQKYFEILNKISGSNQYEYTAAESLRTLVIHNESPEMGLPNWPVQYEPIHHDGLPDTYNVTYTIPTGENAISAEGLRADAAMTSKPSKLINLAVLEKTKNPTLDQGRSVGSSLGFPGRLVPPGIEFIESGWGEPNVFSGTEELDRVIRYFVDNQKLPDRITLAYGRTMTMSDLIHEYGHYMGLFVDESRFYEFVGLAIDRILQTNPGALPYAYLNEKYRPVIGYLGEFKKDPRAFLTNPANKEISYKIINLLTDEWSRGLGFYLGYIAKSDRHKLGIQRLSAYVSYFQSLGLKQPSNWSEMIMVDGAQERRVRGNMERLERKGMTDLGSAIDAAMVSSVFGRAVLAKVKELDFQYPHLNIFNRVQIEDNTPANINLLDYINIQQYSSIIKELLSNALSEPPYKDVNVVLDLDQKGQMILKMHNESPIDWSRLEALGRREALENNLEYNEKTGAVKRKDIDVENGREEDYRNLTVDEFERLLKEKGREFLLYLGGISTKRFDELTTIGGFGLGMLAVRKYVNQVDGNIHVESDPDKGTDIFITIPYKGIPKKTDGITRTDAAMVASSDVRTNDAKGGIDLNPNAMDMQIKRDGKGVVLPVSQQPIEALKNIRGFQPVILNIAPVTNLPLLLGIAPTQKPNPESEQAKLELSAAIKE